MQKLQSLQEYSRRNWKKWFRKDNLIVLVLSGILLFVIAMPTDKKETKKLEKKPSVISESGSGESGQSDSTGENIWEDYAREQEVRLQKILSSMEGVGKVEVMLTFSATEELVICKDTPTVRSGTEEKDSTGGSRTTTQLDRRESTVYRNADGDSEPYVVKTLAPRVEGVLVVAEGAGNGNIKRSVTEIAEALFGVEAHKVVVVPMETAK